MRASAATRNSFAVDPACAPAGSTDKPGKIEDAISGRTECTSQSRSWWVTLLYSASPCFFRTNLYALRYSCSKES